MAKAKLHEAPPDELRSPEQGQHQHHGAPRKRGPVGRLTRLSSVWGHPRVQIWRGPILRGTGVFAVLSCLAFVGARSQDAQIHGPRVDVELEEARALPEASAHEASLAKTNAPDKSADAASKNGTDDAAKAPPCADKTVAEGPSAILPDGRLVLNEATEKDFTHLPGVGASRARAIFELRERLGGFRKVSDLLRVKGIGWKTLQRLKELVVLDRPEAPDAAQSAPPGPSAGDGSGGA